MTQNTDFNAVPCPCGRPQILNACCLPFLESEERAPDPETLMRSRYTAFSLGTPNAIEYLVETHHANFREPKLRDGLRATIASIDAWLKLEVLSSSVDGDRGTVEFIASYRAGRQQGKLHEHSQFEKEAGRWFYTQGEIR